MSLPISEALTHPRNPVRVGKLVFDRCTDSPPDSFNLCAFPNFQSLLVSCTPLSFFDALSCQRLRTTLQKSREWIHRRCGLASYVVTLTNAKAPHRSSGPTTVPSTATKPSLSFF